MNRGILSGAIVLIILGAVIFLIRRSPAPPQLRSYEEIVISLPIHSATGIENSSLMPSSSSFHWSWTPPEDWIEQKGQGMRLATLRIAQNLEEIDCSIISLGGMAGGLEANLVRWMKQINLEVPQGKTAQELLAEHKAISRDLKTMDQVSLSVFDLTLLQKNVSSSMSSMLVAMIATGDTTLFIKLTGTMDAIQKHRVEFFQFIRTFKYKP